MVQYSSGCLGYITDNIKNFQRLFLYRYKSLMIDKVSYMVIEQQVVWGPWAWHRREWHYRQGLLGLVWGGQHRIHSEDDGSAKDSRWRMLCMKHREAEARTLTQEPIGLLSASLLQTKSRTDQFTACPSSFPGRHLLCWFALEPARVWRYSPVLSLSMSGP